MAEQITVELIESKQFHQVAKGYDQEEVDTFLDQICDEMDRRDAEFKSLQNQLREAQMAASRAATEAAPAPQGSSAPTSHDVSTFEEILVMAHQVKDQTIRDAQAKAENILAEAREKAEEQLGNLSSERDSLNRQVEALKQIVKDYKEKFVSLLQAQQDALDKASDL